MIFNLLLTSVVVIAGFYFSIKCFAKMGELTLSSMMEPIPIEIEKDDH